jgi:uncharacterized protein YbcI
MNVMSEENASMSPEKAISRGAIAIYKDYMGRGPESAQTLLTDESSLTTCRNSLTKAENRLVERGESEMVRAMRRKFQDVMRDDYIAMVEDVTKREGESFLSDHDTNRDVAIEVVTFR